MSAEDENLDPALALNDESAMRDTSNLWALSETVMCTLKRCIPCSYKILLHAPTILDGEKVKPQCHKNIRPELCPRQSGKPSDEDAQKHTDKIVGLYSKKQCILVVGDGDFTFSLALANSLGPQANLICTSFQDESEVLSIYTGADETLKKLKTFANVIIRHGVDATRLKETLEGGMSKFSRVIFNFPCVPDQVGKDGQAQQLEDNKSLIRSFILSASSIVDSNDGEIHIVHKTKEPFSWWNIPELCPVESGYKLLRSVVFDRSIYPGYIPRKVGENKSFPVFDAVTYCFSKATESEDSGSDLVLRIENSDAQGNMSPQIAQNFDLVKITKERLLQIVALLQHASTAPVAAHLQGKKRSRATDDVKRRDNKKSRLRQKGNKKQAKGRGK